MDDSLHFSRPSASASNLGEYAPDKHLFLDKRVLLRADPEVLATENGKNCIWASILLLMRICKNIDIQFPVDFKDLEKNYQTNLTDINPVVSPRFLTGEVSLNDYDAILNIGNTVRPDLPWTVINSNGWLARVSSGTQGISAICDQFNPIASLAAASLGVTEVFKRLVKLDEGRGRLLDGFSFSMYSYQPEEGDFGPLLPTNISTDLVVTGAGAIGNGLIFLLGLLPIKGHVSIVDPQDYQSENLGTCLLIGQNEVGRRKANFTVEYLKRRNILAKGFEEKVEVFGTRMGKGVPYSKIIINGLDNIDARHAVQELWPDIVIDGAISDFLCQASRHPWGEDIACLKCLFQKETGTSAEEVARKATGLSPERLANVLEVVTEVDVQAAPEHKQTFLRNNIGKKICSVIQEGVMQQMSKEKQQEGFAPSVPFVACFSASMVMSEFIKFVENLPSSLSPRFQFDILLGPASGIDVAQGRRSNCICVERKINIDYVRSKRGVLNGRSY